MFNNDIQKALTKWESKSIDFLNDLYAGHWIPSHDIFHHQRVFDNAVQILSAFKMEIMAQHQGFFEQLLLACFFHDTGLLHAPGFKHGIESRKICQKFLDQYAELIDYDTDELYMAIELHDEKEYSARKPDEFHLLHLILTLADDMDAFGAVGAYRYAEIYLCRSLLVDEIAEKVLSNASERYNNLKRFLPGMQNLDELYQVLINIYAKNTFSDTPVDLLKMIESQIVNPRTDPTKKFRTKSDRAHQNSRIYYFLSHYLEEWDSKTSALSNFKQKNGF